MKTLKAEIKQAANKQWFWHLKAGNNRIVLVSETYTRKRDCIRSMLMAARMTTVDEQPFRSGMRHSPMAQALYRALLMQAAGDKS